MTQKHKTNANTAPNLTGGGTVELSEEQLAGIEGGSARLTSQDDGPQETSTVTLNFAKVKYVYTPQK